LSTFLDLLRILAALAVFLGHTNFHWFWNPSSIGPQNGQDYVIVFFVLSGFVIAWSTDKKVDLTINQYLFERITRLWSVVLPALIIGCAIDYWGRMIHPPTYQNIVSPDHLWARYVISVSFFHESWFLSIRPGSNAPLWSLSYEFFYYLIFGFVQLIPTLGRKILAVTIASLLAGPKVLLLFPCWLIGAITFKLCKNYKLNSLASLLFFLPSAWFLIDRMSTRWHHWSPWEIPGLGLPPLFYSAKPLDDYLTAFACGLLILGINHWLPLQARSGNHFKTTIRHLAGCSFTLYAIHFPLMAFLAALHSSGKLPIKHLPISIFLILLLCYCLSFIFERPLHTFRTSIISTFPSLFKRCGIRS